MVNTRRGAAIVIGGSGGIGADICQVLARDGWDVAVTYFRNKAKADTACAAVHAVGQAGSTHGVDISDSEAVAQMVANVVKTHGGIGTVVYAAGPLVPLIHLSKITPEQMKSHLIQDTLGFFNVVHAALPHLRAAQGNIVACHSAAQYRYAPADGLSVVPKAGVRALMLGIAKEEGRFGVRANGVAIGLIETGQHTELTKLGYIHDGYMEAAAKATPLRRAGAARDIAEAVAFFADNHRTGFVTGQVISVDGGYSI
ncbi:SDR family NAD(P)-dependent oxidoreductase [Pseudorhodobacter sp.]|uniref:SDR family NAD(P)-dependent oxidoreductase n=1 Tax=Pseudorhodobacter sp. TaxID=1934400 RepID=UPI002B00332E|nr:SDR family oxidoreductase [Pseudorhodobacter sp.]